MKAKAYLLQLLTIICITGQMLASDSQTETDARAKNVAAWTILVYIAADNNLAPYATYNINDMSAGLASAHNVNILVQWDQPKNKSSWRYKITPGGKIDAGTLTSEMGYNPAKELVASMQWATTNYPANHYALVLWDHGSGIEDFDPGIAKNLNLSAINYTSWLNLTPELEERGILYDDSQNTCLTNQGLSTTLGQIKKMIGKNLDIIAMDACLMAMVEVAYQMKDSVNLFVASHQTIPGNGFPYSKFINPLSLNAVSTSPLQLALSMVSGYQEFYTTQQPTSDFTLSTIDVTSIGLIKQNIENFIAAINECNKIDPKKTKKIVVNALKATPVFEMSEYIDLYSFYAKILNQTKLQSPKSQLILNKINKKRKPKTNQTYQNALSTLNKVIQDGLTKITTVVVHNTSGPVYSGVKGISIYYPKKGALHSSYAPTLFAQDTPAWINFINSYR
jgi:hypothetical protein